MKEIPLTQGKVALTLRRVCGSKFSMSFDRSGLLEWQGDAAEQLLAALEKHDAALDGSDLGTGKTAHALAVIRHRKLPTLVVAPKVSETGWRRMGALLGASFSFCNYELLRTGRTPYGTWEHPRPAKRPSYYQCDSCQMKFGEILLKGKLAIPAPCPHHNLGIHCLKLIKKPHRYGKFLWNNAVKQVVFDEVHRAGALDSLNSDMLIGTKRQKIPTLSLSATTADSPLDFRALGFSLGLHHYTDFYPWAAKRGCRKTTWGGFQFLLGESERARVMAELHQEIFPSRGARVRIADLGAAFPEVQITAELYDLSEGGRIDELYAEMDSAIATLNGVRGMDSSAEHPLTCLLRARQELELLKVPLFVEIALEGLSSGYHVAFFVNFRATVDELCRRFKTQCRIDGSQRGDAGAKRRQLCIEDFQRDAEPVIVCSAAAGGVSVSLHDEHGDFPRLGIVSPGYSSREFRQIFGRLRRANGKSKSLYRIPFAAGTVEEKIHRALSSKLNQMDALNDADLFAANIPLTRRSLEELFPANED